MSRPVDADRLLKMMSHWKPYMDMENVREAIKKMPTLTPQNEPLTIEQLREMDGEPVWVVLGDEKWSRLNGWYLVHHGSAYLARVDDWELDATEYGVEWIAYRRPPERQEDTDA